MCKNIAFPQNSFLSCINAICEIFPDDNVPRHFPLEQENLSESAQTAEGGNSSEPTDDEANFDQLAHPIPDEDEEEIPEETSEEVSEQPLDLKRSNSFLN